MTELNLGVSSLTAASADRPKRKPPRAVRVTVATLLSVLLPGFGQIYVRRNLRGVALALSTVAIMALVSERHLMLAFTTMLLSSACSLLWRLAIAVDAGRLAWKYDPAVATPRNWKISIAALVVAFLLVGYPLPDYFQSRLVKFFGAYKIESGSMCPTICIGERVVVNREAYKNAAPQRGDIIAFQFHQETAPFLKRVIGIEGDTVSQGLGNSILVNGNPIPKPQVCGHSLPHDQSGPGAIQFCPVKVPAGALFVVGDNLANSLDSRFPDFGLVNVDHVRGKPIYIYWSRQISRIGCILR